MAHFNRKKNVKPEYKRLYEADKKALEDTLFVWGNFPYSPLAYDTRKWWIDTIIYNEDKKHLLAIVCAMYLETPNRDPYSDKSVWIRGTRDLAGVTFYAASRIEVLAERTGNPKILSYGGRELLMSFWYYYPLTVIKRSKFWVEMFKHIEIIKEMQEDAMKKWKSGQW